MTYIKKNKIISSGLFVVTTSLVMLIGTVNAAEEAADAGSVVKEPVLAPFIKAPVVHTQYTKDCKPLGLKATAKGAKRRTFALNPANFRRMERVSDAMTEELWDEALLILKELEIKAADRPYDLAKTNEYLGYVYLSKGDYNKAITYFRKVIDVKILPVRSEQSLIRNVAGLYLSIDPPQPQKAMGIIEAWFKTAVKPKSSDYILLGQAAVLGKQYERAICPIRMAINLADRPKSSLFDILVAAHYEMSDFIGATTIAKERLLSYPESAKYWRQLSGLYNKLDRSMDALVIYELAYKQNMLTKSSEYKNLSSMYAINDLSYKSASVIEDGLNKGIVEATEKTWKQAGGGWQIARENTKAIAAFTKAGNLSENGLNEMRIGVLYVDKENWNKAVEFFEKALKKGGLKKSTGRTHLNLGIALFNSGNPNDALAALRTARTFKGVKRNATQWIAFVKDSIIQKAAQS
ncbi:MAG: tetratricopeptide (TPR) repeat protein [Enterobacterales bacterium]|jgi:tetratricopeptide (TPR) repeat protein